MQHGDTMATNPYIRTKDFWYREFQMAIVGPDKKLAEEHFLRYRYWLRRVRLWDYLGQLCQQKEFGNAG